MAQPQRQPTLFAIDELPAVGLHNLTEYLATVGSAGVTVLFYAQALALPEAAVVALTLLGGRQYRLIGQRLDPRRTFAHLPPPTPVTEARGTPALPGA